MDMSDFKKEKGKATLACINTSNGLTVNHGTVQVQHTNTYQEAHGVTSTSSFAQSFYDATNNCAQDALTHAAAQEREKIAKAKRSIHTIHNKEIELYHCREPTILNNKRADPKL